MNLSNNENKGPSALKEKILKSNQSGIKKWTGIWGCFGRKIISEYLEIEPRTLVVVSNKQELQMLAFDLSQLSNQNIHLIPTIDYQSEIDSYKNRKAQNDIKSLVESLPSNSVTLLTTIESLLQPNVNISKELPPLVIELEKDYDFEKLKEDFLNRGFVEEEFVTMPGEFACRGNILDFYSHRSEKPIRLDFFGDTLEEIRVFDPNNQTSIETLKKFIIQDIHMVDTAGKRHFDYFSNFLPKDYNILFFHENELVENAGKIFVANQENEYLTYNKLRKEVAGFPSIDAFPNIAKDEAETSLHFEGFSIAKKKGSFEEYIKPNLIRNYKIILCYSSPLEKKVLEKELLKFEYNKEQIVFSHSSLSGSYHSSEFNTAFYSDIELFNKSAKFTNNKKVPVKQLEDFLEIAEDDFVVHANHGVGINKGIKSLQLMGRFEDFLCIEFAENVKVYVPLMNIGLVQKYIGGTDKNPALSKISSKVWAQKKNKARKEVEEIAHLLLSIQAKREEAKRKPYQFDVLDYQEFSEEFPYDETPDQETAIEMVLKDMQSDQYMDRIICGDVGFGKTEIAMRAAYIAVCSGIQVAILAPTTILVEQHFKNFSERFRNFPYIISKVNRFTKSADLKNIKERLHNGSIDVVIGTHKLLSRDFKFNNLGLLIIDEEQRFGVKQKEKLKKVRAEMDLLTLTATPIPRTLHMSLIGIKDISILATPPSNRLPIESKVCKYSEKIIQDAINHELQRKGQIFFVHNRINSLPKKMAELKELVPSAKMAICHGQMHEDEIEKTMSLYVENKVDILLSTTIIESGLDIPNANTIIIDYANMYGLSQLHQMRGRIGRSDRQGFAYMLVHSDKKTTRKAEKRLQAIEEYTNLGAGFNLSMADMEIRGVGNLLGSEQHGSVASVGYDMYCQLLEECIMEMKHEVIPFHNEIELKLNIPAFFPDEFINNDSEKLRLYRKLRKCFNQDDILAFENELIDRFGSLPQEVQNLVTLSKIRNLCYLLNIESAEIVKGELKFKLDKYEDLHLAQILRKLDNIVNLSGLKILTVKFDNEPNLEYIENYLLRFLDRFNQLKEMEVHA